MRVMRIQLFFVGGNDITLDYTDLETFTQDIHEVESIQECQTGFTVIDNGEMEVVFKTSELLAYAVKR